MGYQIAAPLVVLLAVANEASDLCKSVDPFLLGIINIIIVMEHNHHIFHSFNFLGMDVSLQNIRTYSSKVIQ